MSAYNNKLFFFLLILNCLFLIQLHTLHISYHNQIISISEKMVELFYSCDILKILPSIKPFFSSHFKEDKLYPRVLMNCYKTEEISLLTYIFQFQAPNFIIQMFYFRFQIFHQNPRLIYRMLWCFFDFRFDKIYIFNSIFHVFLE